MSVVTGGSTTAAAMLKSLPPKIDAVGPAQVIINCELLVPLTRADLIF